MFFLEGGPPEKSLTRPPGYLQRCPSEVDCFAPVGGRLRCGFSSTAPAYFARNARTFPSRLGFAPGIKYLRRSASRIRLRKGPFYGFGLQFGPHQQLLGGLCFPCAFLLAV